MSAEQVREQLRSKLRKEGKLGVASCPRVVGVLGQVVRCTVRNGGDVAFYDGVVTKVDGGAVTLRFDAATAPTITSQ